VSTPRRILPPTLIGWTYALTVTVLATLGFTTESTSTILLASFLALPSSGAAVPAYYVVYGLLALVPGANPSSSTGSASCTPDGRCQTSTTGDASTWFTLATDATGILALTAAALVNVVVLRSLIAAHRARVRTPGTADR
jgi:hypothetical protein